MLDIVLMCSRMLQKFFTQYNEMAILDFSEMLTKMHKYLMDQINELFKEMG